MVQHTIEERILEYKSTFVQETTWKLKMLLEFGFFLNEYHQNLPFITAIKKYSVLTTRLNRIKGNSGRPRSARTEWSITLIQNML